MIDAVFKTPAKPVKESGLGSRFQSVALALAYSWAESEWTDAQREDIRAKGIGALDAWHKFSHTNLGGSRASNWVAVTRGAELWLMVVLGEQENRRERFDRMKKDLVQHLRSGHSNLSVVQEGLG